MKLQCLQPRSMYYSRNHSFFSPINKWITCQCNCRDTVPLLDYNKGISITQKSQPLFLSPHHRNATLRVIECLITTKNPPWVMKISSFGRYVFVSIAHDLLTITKKNRAMMIFEVTKALRWSLAGRILYATTRNHRTYPAVKILT